MSEKGIGNIDDSTDKRSPANASGTSSGITRRNFLSLSALAACAGLGISTKAHARPEFKGWPDSYGMLVDFNLCVGCRSCEKACNEENKLPAPKKPFDDDKVFEELRQPSEEAYTIVNRYNNTKNPSTPLYRKIQCNHCLEPACATACPIRAYTKTPEGAVIYNEDLCFGCRYCVVACPFNIPGYSYQSALEPKIMKCTFCYPRINKKQLPACAEACPSGALTFGKRADLIKLARKRIMDNKEKYIDYIYGENEVGGTSWLYLSGVPFEQLGFAANLPKKPLIELTEGYLSMVPVIFTTFPAIFAALYATTRYREKQAKKEKDDKQPKEDSHE